MVVTALPAICPIWVWQENGPLPSIWTMQAPHRPVPQPNLVPVSLSSSRITHNKRGLRRSLRARRLAVDLEIKCHGFPPVGYAERNANAPGRRAKAAHAAL